MNEFKICTNCVMDTTDPDISFDKNGICDHCKNYYNNILPYWNTGEVGNLELRKIIAKIKKEGQGKDFDCIMGMSGGADSSYMLHIVVKEFGLRPLVFHVDGGWNSELAVKNIEVIVEKLGLDLYTEVINWEEMKAFQLAYFRSNLPYIDIPQDHAFVATLYKFAEKYKIKYILNGFNYSTECIINPFEWRYYGTDLAQIRDIIKQFCQIDLKTYPFSSVLYHKFYLRYFKGIKVIKPLNFVPYKKEIAMDFLKKEYGWQPYPQKHFESRFTKFYEGFWLPQKFGYDTRKVQYSSLILTGQMTREEAIEKLKLPAIDKTELERDFEYIANKLGISIEELNNFLNQPNKTFRDYKNQVWLFNFGAYIMNKLGIDRLKRS
ncbi:MAG: N-acetyl sugar amidotransferase [Spirosomataceae bacterium]